MSKDVSGTHGQGDPSTGLRGSLFEEEEAGSGDSFLRRVLETGPAPRLPEPGERLGGPDGRRYSVLEWMGGGGMGQVFRARDEVLHREVALKFLLSHSGHEEDVLREARAVARLDHENIVRIFDVSEWHGASGGPGLPFLVMESLEGESLATLLKRGRLEVWRALDILEGITEGLAHAHERHLVHRDLKPSNVFLTKQGGVKLLDFGLSHLTLASAGAAPYLPTSGTPAYMAPEQWRGGPQDARTDVWAAGVVLHEMLTGRLPCRGTTFAEMRKRVLSAEPVPPVRARRPEVPRGVEVLVSTLLAKDPARRFRSALELREELRDVRARLGGGKAPRAASPERRQVTLVSLLLEGPPCNDARLDAEDVSELETAFQETCAELITRHGGTVAWAMGGEVLACFGLPQGREDDSERAVRAGLQVLQGLPGTLRRKLPHLPLCGLSVRGGIHTDVMAVGTRAFQGDAPKVAAWLARQASPGGGLVLGDTSWKRVRGAFDTEPLGARAFESLAGTVHMNVHRVLREREATSRFDRVHGAGRLWPLVGRERELEGLLSRWEEARRGRGAFVLVSGEAGIGKSRLIQELCARVAPSSPLLLRVQCWPRFSAHTAPPALELLQDMARFSPEESPQQRMRTLEARLRSMGLGPEDAHLVGNLLALPVPEDSPILQRTPEWCKERAFEALAHILLYRARHEAPLLLVFEDLHWADSVRLEFLGFLLERVEKARLLVVLSARPEFQPHWPRRPWFHRLVLERLPAGLAALLAKEVARERVLPEETVQRLVSRTDGIPLFIEEMTCMVLEGGTEAAIPVTLHELLLARLDLLPSRQKALAQLCAVVGRDFSHALLAAVSEHEEATLRRELAGLMDAGLLRERRDTDEPAYQFRHALIQDAAYQSLSRGTRRQYHQRIARVLVERFAGLVEAKPEVLAYHFTEAGEHARAIGYWERAGQHALLRQAGPEALGHLTRALELLPVVEGAEQRLHAELRIRMPLGIAAMQVHGIRAPETERMYARIHELILRVGEALPRLDLCFWGIFAYYYVRADLQRMYELAQRLLSLGQRHDHRVLRILGCRMSGTALYAWGRPVEAMAYLERALAGSEFTLEEHRALAAHHWIEPMAGVLAYGSLVCAVRGRMEESRRWAREALELARRVGHPHTLTHTRVIVALTFSLHQEALETLKLAEQAISSAYESNIRVWLAWAELLRGWALSELGRPREGLVFVQRELSGLSMRLIQAALPRDMSLLAEIHLKLGECQEALAVVEDALVQSAATGERNVDAWLHDLRGECLRRLGREEEAKRSFLCAITVARQQGAGLFELRATVSLCRQLREQGRGSVAWRLLSRACARFQSGGDSVDLQEARVLLEALQAGGPGLAAPQPSRT